ncbi:uncharacterized protein J3R85_000139 [Psidium guajava]|nr:uncharacterized protein J3R85_000139 [Psidium guajava]
MVKRMSELDVVVIAAGGDKGQEESRAKRTPLRDTTALFDENPTIGVVGCGQIEAWVGGLEGAGSTWSSKRLLMNSLAPSRGAGDG